MSKKNVFISVFCIVFIIATFIILPVIFGLARTPDGKTYLATAVYFLDYFYYLQFIAQGLRGHWLPRQYFATDDPSLYFHLEPYVLIGQLFRIFGFSPVLAYWTSVFLLNVIYVLLIFLVIRMMLKNKSFYLQLLAFFTTVIIAPFFKIDFKQPAHIVLYDFWFSPSIFFRRFGGIPHHTLSYIFTMAAMLIVALFVSRLKNRSNSNVIYYSFILCIVLSLLLVFYPFTVVTFLMMLGLTTIFYFLYFLSKKNRQAFPALILFNIIVFGIVIICAFIIKKFYYQTTFFNATKGVETAWSQKIPLLMLALNIGPAVILSIFGLKEFIRSVNPMKLIILFFVISSYILFLSPVNYLLNTHNARFLSPLNYILFGTLAALGIDQISSFFKKYKKLVFGLLILLLLAFSLPPNIQEAVNIYKDTNNDSLTTYLPNGIIDGFKNIDHDSEKGNVLTAPNMSLGAILPGFANHRVYIARDAATPDFQAKSITATNFYLGNMTFGEAREFLNKNDLKFVVWTPYEGYDITALSKYPFLKEVYRNKDIIVFKVR